MDMIPYYHLVFIVVHKNHVWSSRGYFYFQWLNVNSLGWWRPLTTCTSNQLACMLVCFLSLIFLWFSVIVVIQIPCVSAGMFPMYCTPVSPLLPPCVELSQNASSNFTQYSTPGNENDRVFLCKLSLLLLRIVTYTEIAYFSNGYSCS